MTSDEVRTIRLDHDTLPATLAMAQFVRTGHVMVVLEMNDRVSATNLTLDQVRELRDWLTASLPEPVTERIACTACGTSWSECRGRAARCCPTCRATPPDSPSYPHPIIRPVTEPLPQRGACMNCGTSWETCRLHDLPGTGRPRCCSTCASAPPGAANYLHPIIPQEK